MDDDIRELSHPDPREAFDQMADEMDLTPEERAWLLDKVDPNNIN